MAYISKSTRARALLREQFKDGTADEKLNAIQKIGKTRFGTHWLAAHSVVQCLSNIRDLVRAKEIKFSGKVSPVSFPLLSASLVCIYEAFPTTSKRRYNQYSPIGHHSSTRSWNSVFFNMLLSFNLSYDLYGLSNPHTPRRPMSTSSGSQSVPHSMSFSRRILRRLGYLHH